MKQVNYKVFSTIQRFTWSGLLKKVPPYVHVFRYTGSTQLRGNLEITDDFRGHVELRQYLVTVNKPPDPTVVSAGRRMMQRIEIELETHWGVEHLQDLVRESCLEVDCPALEDARASRPD